MAAQSGVTVRGFRLQDGKVLYLFCFVYFNFVLFNLVIYIVSIELLETDKPAGTKLLLHTPHSA